MAKEVALNESPSGSRSGRLPEALKNGRGALQRPRGRSGFKSPGGQDIRDTNPWSRMIHKSANFGSVVVGLFAVRSDIQAFALFVFRDAQTDSHIDQLEGDE